MRDAYEKLIAENIAWLLKQPRTLERDHIEQIVRRSPDHEYGPRAQVPQRTNGVWPWHPGVMCCCPECGISRVGGKANG